MPGYSGLISQNHSILRIILYDQLLNQMGQMEFRLSQRVCSSAPKAPARFFSTVGCCLHRDMRTPPWMKTLFKTSIRIGTIWAHSTLADRIGLSRTGQV